MEAKTEAFKKKKEENGPKDRVEFEELPRKLQKKINKRKQKREELRAQRKHKIDWEKPNEVILERYKEVFPEKTEANLLENIKYQKLIYNATSGANKRKKGAPSTE